ncbi:MAG: mechanosensitive ion channel family protein [Melioribacteraceae bacterium]|nr:mechanosensitive ion channel family protein [Melioribacteraceae bacterium]
MKFIKTSPIFLPFTIFAISLILSLLQLFEIHPTEAGTNYYADHLFYYLINSTLWLSGALLFNILVHTFIWNGLFKRPISNNFNQIIIDFISVSIYVFALMGILTKVVKIELNTFWLTIAVIILIVGTALRRRALLLSSGSLFTTDKPFNIGDWIEVIDNSIGKVEGEVIDIRIRNIKLKSADNTVTIIPQSVLSNIVVKNYSGSKDQVSIQLFFNLSSAYPTERVKRVLMASVIDALTPLNISDKEPEINISATNELGIEYSIKYFIRPEKITERTEINDLIYKKVLSHLSFTGMKLITKDSLFPTEQSYFQFGYDKKLILLHNELFSHFTKKEIDQLSRKISVFSVAKEDVLIKQNESGESMFLVVEGLLKVSMKTAKGEVIQLAILSPGAYLGEMSLFTGEPRSATVAAISDSIVCEIKKEDIREILNNRSELVEAISDTITDRTIMNIQAIEDAGKKKKHFYDNILGKIKSFFNL